MASPISLGPMPVVTPGDAASYIARAKWTQRCLTSAITSRLHVNQIVQPIDDLREALRLDAGFGAGWLAMAEHLSEQDVAQALACYRKAFALGEQQPAALLQCACMCEAATLFEDAAHFYSKTLAVAPSWAGDVLWRRAQTRLQLGDLKGALDDLTACPAEPGVSNVTIPLQRAQILWMLGRYEDAWELVRGGQPAVNHYKWRYYFIWALMSAAALGRGRAAIDELRGVVDRQQVAEARRKLGISPRDGRHDNMIAAYAPARDDEAFEQAVLSLFLGRLSARDYITKCQAAMVRSDAWEPPAYPLPIEKNRRRPVDGVWRGQVYFYLGQYHLMNADVDKAREILIVAASTERSQAIESFAASIELSRLPRSAKSAA